MSFVQGISNTAAAATSVSFTFGAGVTNGNCVVGCVTLNSNVAVTFTITFGGVTCTQLDQIVDSANGECTQSFILGNITGAPTAGSISWTGNFDAAVIALEESNCLAVANPTDVHTAQMQTNVTNPSSGNVTTTVANDNIIGFSLNDGGTTTFTAGAGFTLRNTTLLSAVLPFASEDTKVQASPGSVAATFTNSQTQNYSTFVVAIKPAAVASGIPVLSRPIQFRPYSKAPFLNRLPPTTSPPPNIPPGVPVQLSEPIRFKPFVKAPFLNRLQPVTPPVTSVTVSPGFGSIVLNGFPPALSVTVVPGFGSIVLSGFPPTGIGAGTLGALAAPIQLKIYKTAPLFAQVRPATAATANIVALPGFGSLTLTGLPPALSLSVTPGTASVVLTGFAPITRPVPATAHLLMTGFAPITRPLPNSALLFLTGFAPTITNTPPGGGGGRVLTTMSARIISGS